MSSEPVVSSVLVSLSVEPGVAFRAAISNRVIAEAPSFAFMEGWTRNQVNSYMNGKPWRVNHELIGGSWKDPEEKEEHPLHVHKPMEKGDCWMVMDMPARRSGLLPAYEKQCGQRARSDFLTCQWHERAENAAQALRRQLEGHT